MDTHPSESSSVAYLIEREEKLAAAKVCALVDRRHARDKMSLRWDVLGVLVPRGILHSKVSLLAWGNHVRVIIGSGNLTEPGYRKNLEVFGVIDASRSTGGDVTAINATLAFLDSAIDSALGENGEDTAKTRVRQSVAEVRRRVSRWTDVAGLQQPIFGTRQVSVITQVGAHWPGGGPPRSASIVSPFFDKPGRDRLAIGKVIDLLAKRGKRSIEFSVRVDQNPDGSRRVFAPKGMVDDARRVCSVSVYPVTGRQGEDVRSLHAKMLMLKSEQVSALLIGSSNFTAAGIVGSDTFGNLEANLLYIIKSTDSRANALEKLWPETGESLDLDASDLIWNPEPEEAEGGDLIPLPACFRDATFAPGAPSRLIVALGSDLPKSWTIRVPHGRKLLGSAEGIGAGRHTIEWDESSPPFVLEVSWGTVIGEAVSDWPVNVGNPAELPPPDELRGLGLEELLAILSSTRPLYDAVSRVLAGRTQKPKQDIDLDPLKRHDSQAMLLRRTKRVSAALDHLRERLERPALTKEAYEWRLRGPVGPLALADAFVREATLPGEAGFYLAELALAISRVNPSAVIVGGLSRSVVKGCLASTIAEAKRRIEGLSSMEDTKSLDSYIQAAFGQAEAK